MELPTDKFTEIAKEIDKRAAKRKKETKCPICGHKDVYIGPYFTQIIGTEKMEDPALNVKASLPSVPVICGNCGFIMQFALGTLGFYKAEEKEHDKK